MEKTEIARRIKTLRERKGLKQNTLANLAGVSPTYIYQLEHGEKSPTVEYLGYICDALGITLEQFFSDGQTFNQTNRLDDLTPAQRSLLNDFLNSL